MREGKVVHARLDDQPTSPSTPSASTTCSPGAPASSSSSACLVEGTDRVTVSTTHLLMEGARLMDEAGEKPIGAPISIAAGAGHAAVYLVCLVGIDGCGDGRRRRRQLGLRRSCRSLAGAQQLFGDLLRQLGVRAVAELLLDRADHACPPSSDPSAAARRPPSRPRRGARPRRPAPAATSRTTRSRPRSRRSGPCRGRRRWRTRASPSPSASCRRAITSRISASSTVPVNPFAVRRSMTLVLIMRIRLAVFRSLALIAAVSCSRSCPSRLVDIATTYHRSAQRVR